MSQESVKAALALIKEQYDEPLPTPAIGADVWWYDRGEVGEGKEVAAKVVGVEAPGQLILIIFRPMSIPIHKKGVCHTSHPQHLHVNNPTTVQNGAWGYIRNKPPIQADLEYHRDLLIKREKAILADEKRYEDAQANKAAIQAAAKAPKQSAATP